MMGVPSQPDRAGDLALLARARNGDGQAFAEIIEPHRSGLYRYLARRAGSADEAEDLVQQTLIRAWNGLHRYEDRGTFAAWLFRVARNVLIDWVRGERRRQEVSVEHPRADTDREGADAQATLELEETARVIARAVDSLPDMRRSVFLLRQDGGLTFREIAESLDIPLGTALSHMHHAIRQVRRVLETHDGPS